LSHVFDSNDDDNGKVEGVMYAIVVVLVVFEGGNNSQ
jgi:hypothetical protein